MHGAGENRSNETRIGLINLYSLVWLRAGGQSVSPVPRWNSRGTSTNECDGCSDNTTHDRLGDRLGKYCGSDASFIDKDNLRPPYSPEEKGGGIGHGNYSLRSDRPEG